MTDLIFDIDKTIGYFTVFSLLPSIKEQVFQWSQIKLPESQWENIEYTALLKAFDSGFILRPGFISFVQQCIKLQSAHKIRKLMLFTRSRSCWAKQVQRALNAYFQRFGADNLFSVVISVDDTWAFLPDGRKNLSLVHERFGSHQVIMFEDQPFGVSFNASQNEFVIPVCEFVEAVPMQFVFDLFEEILFTPLQVDYNLFLNVMLTVYRDWVKPIVPKGQQNCFHQWNQVVESKC